MRAPQAARRLVLSRSERVTVSPSLAEALRAGDRRALARAITLVESTRPDHRAEAETLLAAISPNTGSSIRIGISGPPGAGKSTFIECFGLDWHRPRSSRRRARVDPPQSAAAARSSPTRHGWPSWAARRTPLSARPRRASAVVVRHGARAKRSCCARRPDLTRLLSKLSASGSPRPRSSEMTDMFRADPATRGRRRVAGDQARDRRTRRSRPH